MIIYHISDIHIGSSYFVEEYGKNVIKIINNDNCDILAVTGDLTHEGHYIDYKKVREYINKIKSDVKLIKDLNINLVISGHKHVPFIWRLENTYFITAGTATTNRTRGNQKQSFNKIEITDKNIKVYFINTSTGSKEKVLGFNAK